MKTIHSDRDMRNYGSPRMHRELVARGENCSENTVAKLMRDHGMRSASSRKFRVTTDSNHSLPVAENVLNREFSQESPDRVWLADITYIATREGWLFLACVLDTYSRRIVGWSMSERITKDLVLEALRMALGSRRPDRAGGLLHHSDRGSQYASRAFQELLREENITCSMSRKGNCWDNAMMESFFATLKKERVHLEEYATRAEARAIHTNGPPSGAFRGFGVPQAAILQETLYDDLAIAAGFDRLAFRRLNAVAALQA